VIWVTLNKTDQFGFKMLKLQNQVFAARLCLYYTGLED
jgi:hypothetical protein